MEPNFWFKNWFCVTLLHGVPYLACSSFENRSSVILHFSTLVSRAKSHMCWSEYDDCDAIVCDGSVITTEFQFMIYCVLFYFIELCFGSYSAAVDVPPSSSSQALATTPWGYGTSPPINSSPSWEATRTTWLQLRSTGAGSSWRQVMRPRLEACWNMFSRHFSHVVPMLWCFQSAMLRLMMKMMSWWRRIVVYILLSSCFGAGMSLLLMVF